MLISLGNRLLSDSIIPTRRFRSIQRIPTLVNICTVNRIQLSFPSINGMLYNNYILFYNEQYSIYFYKVCQSNMVILIDNKIIAVSRNTIYFTENAMSYYLKIILNYSLQFINLLKWTI